MLARTKKGAEDLEAAINMSTAALTKFSKAAAAADPHNPNRGVPQSDPSRGGTPR